MSSSAAVAAYAPINTPKPVAPALWIVDGPIMRAGPRGLVPVPIRMTVVRLPDATLWLHSPVPYDAALAAALGELGAIGHLVAPNLAHHSFIGEWQRRFPQAVLHGVEGLAAHAAKKGRPLRVDASIGETADPRWGGAFEILLARGRYMTEAVFFHRATRTLVLTDLIENFEPQKVHSAALRLGLRAIGTLAPHGATPRYYRLTFIGRDRARLRAAVQTMLRFMPQRVLFAHGRWFDRDADAQLRRAFAWLKPG